MESNTVQQGKIFVGGISLETTEEELTKHFCHYGEVVKSQIIKFRETGFGKGFGFVTFADSSVLDQLLQDQHIILGRTVDVKLAIPKGESRQCQRCSECQQFQRQNSETSRISHTRKIFVGGLPACLSEEEFKKYFESYGRIEDAKIIHDRGTNTPRGFGFVTYESEEAVTNVLQNRYYLLNNKRVEVKRTEPRERRVMDTCNYNFYPTYSGYELWPIYDSYGIYAPHYWSNHTTGTNVPVPQPILVPVPVPYFTPRHPVNCYGSMHNQVANERGSGEVSSNSAQNSCDSDYWGSHNSVSHEGNDQYCNNIEVQLVGNDSSRDPESTKPLEIEADNGEKDKSVKHSQVNPIAENDEKDHSVENSQVNYLADNGEKDQCVKTSQVNTEAKYGEKDHSEKIFQVNAEHDTSEDINGVSRCV